MDSLTKQYESKKFNSGRSFLESGASPGFIKWFIKNQNESKTHRAFKRYLELIGIDSEPCEMCKGTGKMYGNEDVYAVCICQPDSTAVRNDR